MTIRYMDVISIKPRHILFFLHIDPHVIQLGSFP